MRNSFLYLWCKNKSGLRTALAVSGWSRYFNNCSVIIPSIVSLPIRPTLFSGLPYIGINNNVGMLALMLPTVMNNAAHVKIIDIRFMALFFCLSVTNVLIN